MVEMVCKRFRYLQIFPRISRVNISELRRKVKRPLADAVSPLRTAATGGKRARDPSLGVGGANDRFQDPKRSIYSCFISTYGRKL